MNEKNYKYRTIVAPSQGDYRSRGSKFYAYIHPVKDRDHALEYLREIKNNHPKARHYCFAWRLDSQGQDYRTSDDGEPGGSAGQPILNQLISYRVTKVFAIVVRYFGGTKLGIPGLIRAYKTATRHALESSTIIEKHLHAKYEVEAGYDHASTLMNALQESDIEVLDTVYENIVSYSLKVPLPDHMNKLKIALARGLDLPAVESLEKVPSLIIKLICIES